MNRLIYIIATVCTLLLPVWVHAGILKGKVTGPKGEPMPFATVFVQGTTMGTTTNADAVYQLYLQPGTHKVLCQYMGFRQTSFTITISGEETVTHDFRLEEQPLEMRTLVVKANAEDPAYAIIRKAIKKRQFHLEQVQSFQASIYLKGVFRNRAMPKSITGLMSKKDSKEMKEDMGLDTSGKGLLYLCEEEADYYAAGGKQRTVIRSVRESGNPNGFGLSQMPPIITFYANNPLQIQGICPRGFISPISDNALHYYSYKYEGEFREGGYTIDKIKVTPKRDYEPLLQGTIYIVEDDWAIHSLDLLATTKSNLELLDTLRFQQAHLLLKKDTWVVKSQVMYPTLKFFGFDISGYFATVYDKQKVNGPMPDTIFNKKIISSYEPGANKKDTTYWTENRPIPLERDELRDYVVKDSIRVVQSDPKRIDSIRRRENKFKPSELLMGGVGFTTKKKFSLHTNSLLNFDLVNYNTVEGVNVSPKLDLDYKVDTGKSIEGKVYTRYGFSNTHFNALGRFMFVNSSRTLTGKKLSIGIEGGKYVYQYNPQSTLTPIFNTYTTLVNGENHMKLYERMGGAAFFNKNYGNGLRFEVKAGYERRLPLQNTITYSLAPDADEKITPNVPAELGWVKWEEHDAAIANISISYKPGATYTQYPDHKVAHEGRWPLFKLNYQKAVPGIANSKADFDKWRFAIEDDVNMKMFGSLSYNIAAGGFLNDNYVSIPDMMHLADNELALAAPYLHSFQLAPYYLYSNQENIYGELHLEYSLKGLLTNKIPLLRQAKWYLVAGTNTFYAGQNDYYTEAFAGIDNLGYKLYRFLRLDVVHSWDNMKRESTGVRIGLNLFGISAISLSRASDEEM